MRVDDTETDPLAAERRLVARMLAGDRAAMERFADDYFPPLYRFAVARLDGDRELARDLVQTTVVKALDKLASFRGESSLATWLCACCRNEVLMHFRRRRSRPPALELDAESGPAAELVDARQEGPEGDLHRRQEAQLVHAALDELPPRYAQALEWKYLERQPVEEIARRLSLGAKAAESLLTRARRAFRAGYENLRNGTTARLVPFSAREG